MRFTTWARIIVNSGFLSFHHQEAGKALVEHALLLAIIVGSLAISLEAIGYSGKNAFLRLARVHHPSAADSANPGWSGDEQKSTFAETTIKAEGPESTGGSGLAMATAVGLLVATLSVHFLNGRKPPALLRNDAPEQAGGSAVPVRLQARYLSKRQDIFRGLAGDAGRLLHNQLIVAQIMSRPSGQAGPEKSGREIAELMRERQTHHVLICSAQGDLLGVVSDRDLAKGLDKTAGEIMARDPITTTPEASISGVVSLLLERRISSLPVVRAGKLVGIVTMSDIAMTLQCSLQLIDQLLQQIEQGDAARNNHPGEEKSAG